MEPFRQYHRLAQCYERRVGYLHGQNHPPRQQLAFDASRHGDSKIVIGHFEHRNQFHNPDLLHRKCKNQTCQPGRLCFRHHGADNHRHARHGHPRCRRNIHGSGNYRRFRLHLHLVDFKHQHRLTVPDNRQQGNLLHNHHALIGIANTDHHRHRYQHDLFDKVQGNVCHHAKSRIAGLIRTSLFFLRGLSTCDMRLSGRHVIWDGDPATSLSRRRAGIARPWRHSCRNDVPAPECRKTQVARPSSEVFRLATCVFRGGILGGTETLPHRFRGGVLE